MSARPDQLPRGVAPRRDRVPVLAGALATLVVIVVPYAASGGPRDDPARDADAVDLPFAAQRVLDEFPAAFETAGLVVVPASTDPGVVWTGPVGSERVAGELVELGVSGLVDHGYLPSSGNVPPWAVELEPADRVLSDTGPLSFACTRWPGASTCSGSLLARFESSHYIVRSGLDVPADPDAVLRFPVLDLGEPATLTLGAVRPGTARVELQGASDRVVAWMSEPGAIAGETLWWAVSDEAPQVLRAFDSEGELLGSVDLGG